MVLGPILDGTVAIVRTDRYGHSFYPYDDNYDNSDTSRADQEPQDSYNTNFYSQDQSSEQLYAETVSLSQHMDEALSKV